MLRQHETDLPVIAASATPLPSPGDAVELGFDGFVAKSIERPALPTAIGACLDIAWHCDEQRASAPETSPPAASRGGRATQPMTTPRSRPRTLTSIP
jgi:hypothetical protein